METQDEVERLQATYLTYRETNRGQTLWSQANQGNQIILRERTDQLQQILEKADLFPLTNACILEVGCCSGEVLASLTQWGALPDNLYGIDLLPDRIEKAKQKFPDIHFAVGNAEQSDFTDSCFDLVLLFTVFTSILDKQMACNVATEVKRIVKPGGAVVWYDFRYNNPMNPHVRGIRKKDIQNLFVGLGIQLKTITLMPPLARRLGKHTATLYPLLSKIPFLRTHFIGLIFKPIRQPDLANYTEARVWKPRRIR